jgi:hypothetical protein
MRWSCQTNLAQAGNEGREENKTVQKYRLGKLFHKRCQLFGLGRRNHQMCSWSIQLGTLVFRLFLFCCLLSPADVVLGLKVGDVIWSVPARSFAALCFSLSKKLSTLILFCHGSSSVSLFFITHSVEGFIMDTICIDLGYLLDNPSVRTLENPGVHSFHW